MGIFQAFYKDPNNGNIICKMTLFHFCFKSMDVGCKEFMFSLLNVHDTWGIGMNVSIT